MKLKEVVWQVIYGSEYETKGAWIHARLSARDSATFDSTAATLKARGKYLHFVGATQIVCKRSKVLTLCEFPPVSPLFKR